MKIELCAFSDEAETDFALQLEALKENNIKLMELRTADGINVADIPEAKAREMKELLNSSGISVYSLGSPVGKSCLSEPPHFEENRLAHLIKLCKIFGCDKIRIFSYFTSLYDSEKPEVIKRLKSLVALAAKESIKLYHENEKDIFGDVSDRILILKKGVPGLNFIFDFANYIQVGEDIEKCIAVALDFAGYLHIKDCIASTGEIVPAGEGDGKISEALLKLKENTVLSVEPHLRLFEGYSALDASEMKNKYVYPSGRLAFNAACGAIKELLKKAGYREIGGEWIR